MRVLLVHPGAHVLEIYLPLEPLGLERVAGRCGGRTRSGSSTAISSLGLLRRAGRLQPAAVGFS